ncbi:hypothetical protein [uncultured Tateyamaria sp.]|uniref:hypothetical protein n=1 Tax=uncultured Tateyamaria sp. TaxID=455651 RepID=UPI002607B48A|nr:hypothetical protein [uncultured Tateyamaria sp.]
MFRPILALALGAAIFVPTLGAAQEEVRRERFDIPIFPIDANTFEVIENDGAGGTQMWCAAGIYTRQFLGQRGGSIYIQAGRDNSRAIVGRKSVIFTTQAVEGAFSSTSQGIRRTGQVFSMAHAYALCRGTPRLQIKIRENRL